MATTITASMVNELRSKTGQAMMDCKRMLTETGGDVQAAIDAFRKKGVKTSITERAANEGRLAVGRSADGKTASVVVVQCNTDFTARSEVVEGVLNKAIAMLLNDASVDLANDAQIKQTLAEASQQTGENVQIGRGIALTNNEGSVGTYLYAITGKIGVLMSVTGPADDDLFKQLGGHIAFARPAGLTRDEVPAELVAKEKEIAVAQAMATGKPQQIAEKIAEGKMNSFYAERVLLDQEFFNAQVFKGTISAMLQSKGVTLHKYERVEV